MVGHLNPEQFPHDFEDSGGEQLAMFATAGDLMHNYRHSEGGMNDQIDSDHQRQKLREAQNSGLAADIKKYGVIKPVNVEHSDSGKEMLNGHHRMTVANSINPDMLVPINHTDNMFENEFGKHADPSGYRKRLLSWRYRTDRPSPLAR